MRKASTIFIIGLALMSVPKVDQAQSNQRITPEPLNEGVRKIISQIPFTGSGATVKFSDEVKTPTDWKVSQVIENLKAQDPTVQIHFTPDGALRMMSGTSLYKLREESPIYLSVSKEKEILRYLNTLAPILNLDHPEEELKLDRVETDDLGLVHYRFKQQYQGIPVWGGDLIVHCKGDNIQSINGRFYPTPELANVKASILPEASEKIVLGFLKGITEVAALTPTEKEILHYDKPVSEVVIFPDRENPNKMKLAYHATIRPNFMERYEVFTDTQTGSILNHYDNTCYEGPVTAKATTLKGKEITINTYELGGKFYMLDASRSMFNSLQSKLPDEPVGGIMTYDNGNKDVGAMIKSITSTNNTWTDKTAVTAHYNCGEAYKYFETVHNRKSLDNKGLTIRAFINVANSNGTGLDNAFWNGQVMAFGNGASRFNPLAAANDIATHELSHGVIENSANLVYQDQSGAMNESFADIFGAMVDREDWKIAEDVVKTSAFKSGALRDMSNPNQGLSGVKDRGWQPKHMNEFVKTTANNGGVHSNSGIINFAYFKYATATSKEVAEKVFYRALTVYLTRTAQFIDLRLSAQKAAADLFGDKGKEYAEVTRAFDDVGILKAEPTPPPRNLDEIEGTDFIFATGIKDKDITLYDVQGDKILPATQRKSNGTRISVTDNGYNAYFVDDKGKIVHLNMQDINNILENEVTVGDTMRWYAVAVSADHKRLGLISAYQDTSIYVYHIPSQRLQKFPLFTPTFSDDSTTGGRPLYASNILWNYKGEYVLYEAFYEYQNESGAKYGYSDIVYVRSWDPAGKAFGDGANFSLISNLPGNTNVGAPFYTKNSPHIIGFDVAEMHEVNGKKDTTYSLKAINTETGLMGKLVKSNFYRSYGSYSTDDKQLVYQSRDTSVNTPYEGVAIINLKDDKINALADTKPFFMEKLKGYGQPLWFVQGIRVGMESLHQGTSSLNFNASPIPFAKQLTLKLELRRTGDVQIEIMDMTGKILSSVPFVNQPAGEIQLSLDHYIKNLSAGVYSLKVTTPEGASSQKIFKAEE